MLRSRILEAENRGLPVASLFQIPTPPSDFKGRQTELVDLQSAAESLGISIFVIRGMGGLGKTSFALKAVERLSPHYPDAQVYLDLRGVSETPLECANAMAHVIWTMHPETRLPETEEKITALYRSALRGKRVLLLMDNASGRDQVESLIPPTGNLLLVTSRFRFHLPGSRAYDLQELSTEDSRELLLDIDPRVGSVADQIAEACTGLPFALRQAGNTLSARPDLSASRYADQLAREKEKCGLVEASIGLSYDLLTEEAAGRWKALAIFPTEFDAHAAACVWDTSYEEAEETLGDLVVRSLVQGTDGRYRLHDLASAFASSRLGPRERFEAEMRHSKYYLLRLANNASILFEGEEVDALRAFDEDWSHFRAGFQNALNASHAEKTAADLAVLYPVACQPFFALRIHLQEALKWLNKSLAIAREGDNLLHLATILNVLGLQLRDSGRHLDAVDRFREALTIASDLNNLDLEGTILGNLGNELVFLGETEEAKEVLDRALLIARDVADPQDEMVVLGGLERLYSETKDYPRALDFAQQWLTVARRLGKRHSEGQALGNMGVIYMHLDEPRKALECFEADLEISRELGDQWGEAASLGNLGWAHAHSGNLAKAVDFLETRIRLSRSLHDIRGEAESSWSLGWLYEEMGDLVRAANLLQVRLDYLRSINHPKTLEAEADVKDLRARIR